MAHALSQGLGGLSKEGVNLVYIVRPWKGERKRKRRKQRQQHAAVLRASRSTTLSISYFGNTSTGASNVNGQELIYSFTPVLSLRLAPSPSSTVPTDQRTDPRSCVAAAKSRLEPRPSHSPVRPQTGMYQLCGETKANIKLLLAAQDMQQLSDWSFVFRSVVSAPCTLVHGLLSPSGFALPIGIPETSANKRLVSWCYFFLLSKLVFQKPNASMA